MKEWFEGYSVDGQPGPLIIPALIWLALFVGVTAGLLMLTRGFQWI